MDSFERAPFLPWFGIASDNGFFLPVLYIPCSYQLLQFWFQEHVASC